MHSVVGDYQLQQTIKDAEVTSKSQSLDSLGANANKWTGFVSPVELAQKDVD